MLTFAETLTALGLSMGCALALHGQELLTVTAHISAQRSHRKSGATNENQPPSAIWLTPLHAVPNPNSALGSRTYTLLQKNKQFSPHILLVPVGSIVQFPNADPFFHNVFSLFDGRRFDLGLYEAGSSRGVTFGREGISYIFCNIHPEMSAVVIALSTPYYGVGESRGRIRIPGVPAADYTLHVWVQGADQAALNALTRQVHVSEDSRNLGEIVLPEPPHIAAPHENKFGKGYDTKEPPVY